MTKTRELEPVGTTEVAERLGVARATVEQWQARSRRGELPVAFPARRWTVGGGPAWDWGDVEAWARETGRLT